MDGGTPVKDTLFSVVPDIVKPFSSNHLQYKVRGYVPPELNSGKTPSQIVADSISGLQGTPDNLEVYFKSINTVLNILDFYLRVCKKRPELARACSEDVESLRYHHRTIEKGKKIIDDLLNGKYNQKRTAALTRKIRYINSTVVSAMQEVRNIFLSYEEELHQPLPVQAYHPNNPISH